MPYCVALAVISDPTTTIARRFGDSGEKYDSCASIKAMSASRERSTPAFVSDAFRRVLPLSSCTTNTMLRSLSWEITVVAIADEIPRIEASALGELPSGWSWRYDVIRYCTSVRPHTRLSSLAACSRNLIAYVMMSLVACSTVPVVHIVSSRSQTSSGFRNLKLND